MQGYCHQDQSLKRKIKSLSQKKTKRTFQCCFQQVVVCEILYFSQPKGNEWIKCQEHITFLFSGQRQEAECFRFLLQQIPTNLVVSNNVKLSYNSESQKSKIGLIGLKLRCWQGCVPSGGSRENLFPCFSSFQRLPAFFGSWPSSSSKPETKIEAFS